MSEFPCKNPNCNSYGQPHPNCKCYGGMAEGGMASSFCSQDRPHKPGCPYAKGGEVNDGFSLQEETENHYTIKHPKGDVLKIAKNGLSEAAHGSIKKMARGGEVKNVDTEQSKATQSSGPVTIHINSAKPEVQRFEEGGQAQPNQSEPQSPQNPPDIPAPTAPIPGADISKVPNIVGQMNQASSRIEAGAGQQAQAEKQIAAQSAPVYEAQAQQAQEQFNNVKAKAGAITDEQMKLANEIATGQVDFNRIWHNAGTGQKILAGLSVALGGVGSGITHGPNMALQTIDKIIERDIESQKAVMNNKKTALGAYNDVMQNIDHSSQLMHTLGQAATIAQLNKITAGMGGTAAEAKKNILLGQMLPKLQMQTNNLAIQRANWEYVMKGSGPSQQNPQTKAIEDPILGRTGNVNLKQLQALQMSGIMPKEDVPNATKEAKEFQEAQTTKSLLVNDLNQMKEAVKQNRNLVGKFSEPLSMRHAQERVGKLPFELGKGISEGEPWGGPIARKYATAKASAMNKINTLLTRRIGGEALKNIDLQVHDRMDTDEEMDSKTQRIMKLIDATNSAPTLDKWGLIK